MIRTSLAIFLNWCATTAFATLTGAYDAWWFFIIVDTISAAVILHQPAARVQALIGCTFMGQILLHVVYAFSNHNVGAYPYWQMLTAGAFVQLLLLGGWTIAGWRGEYDGLGRVASVRPKSEWLANNSLVIVLALLAAQQAYFNFNGTTTADIAVLKSQMATVLQRCQR
jgi:hypothetical protein